MIQSFRGYFAGDKILKDLQTKYLENIVNYCSRIIDNHCPPVN